MRRDDALYNASMYRSRYVGVISILLALTATAYAPTLISGIASQETGEAALRDGDYARAALAFGSAAPKLPWKQQLWEMSGLAAYQAGDYTGAVRMLQTARDRGLLSPTGWEVLGSSLWALRMPEPALKAWLAGTKLHADAPGLWDRLAGAYHELRDYSAEQAALERRLAIAEDAAAQYRLALLLLGRDNRGALSALEAAATLDAQVIPAQSTLKAAVRAASLEPTESARWVVVGRSLGLVEEWALAARAFQAAGRTDPTNAEARAWLGEARQHLNENGREDLDAAMSLDPGSSVVHTLRGLYWRRQGSLGLSLAEYARAAQIEPQNAGLQALLGEAYAASGDLVAALDAYENAVELAPGESGYWRLLAMFSADNNVQPLDVGVAAGLKAVQLAPKDPQALDALGWAYAQAGYLSKAEESLRKAIDAAPAYGGAHLHLGITYLRWGQNDLAREQLEQAATVDVGGSAGESALNLLQKYFSQ